jgi:hypothetical protein
MSDELYQIEVQLSDNSLAPAKLLVWEEAPEDEERVKLTLDFNGKEISSVEDDYFSAMCSIRRVLEQGGALLRCYGASRNVYPSGMSRSMGGGVKAYKMSMGSPAKTKDLVSIFETGPDVDPVTVAEQEDFFKKWIQSLGG